MTKQKLEEKLTNALNNHIGCSDMNAGEEPQVFGIYSASKECTDVAILFAIDVLNDLDNEMLQKLIDYPREIDASKDDAIEAWHKTAWHKLIQIKIWYLQSLLNNKIQ